MKTKERAKKQVERILQRLAVRGLLTNNANSFKKRALRLLDYVHTTYC